MASRIYLAATPPQRLRHLLSTMTSTMAPQHSNKSALLIVVGACILLVIVTMIAANRHLIATSTTRIHTEEDPLLLHTSILQSNNKRSGAIEGTREQSNTNTTTISDSSSSLGALRRDWSNNPVRSRYAKLIQQSQSNCSMPEALFHVDNSFGIGSHLALWSQAVCNGWEVGSKVRTLNPQWLWLDQDHCDANEAQTSPLLCYLPKSEAQGNCPATAKTNQVKNVTDPRNKRTWCSLLQDQNTSLIQEFRAASTEYLFQRVSPLVMDEARRQAKILFPEGVAPPDLITVHIRWGDKFWEMELAAIQEYIEAVSKLLLQRPGHNDTANIYLATEDPRAVEEFRKAAPESWNIFVDVTVQELDEFRPKRGNRASHTTKNTRGRAGLVAMGSLLVAMEANDFVLTTQSNWSRLMDQLRTQILEAAMCAKEKQPCTRLIDLRPGVW